MARGITKGSNVYKKLDGYNYLSLDLGDNSSADDLALVRIDTHDYSKHPYFGASADFRIGDCDIGSMLNFAPYESGYCFLTVMGTPRMMQNTRTGSKKAYGKNDNKHPKNQRSLDDADSYGVDHTLMESFIRILEKEFLGLSGIEDIQIQTNDISNNIINVPVPSGSETNNYTNISMTFTEKSGLPITKFLDRYVKYIYDPSTKTRTYCGKANTDNASKAANGRILKRKRAYEVFTLLYVITDRTGLLVEKAFVLNNAMPMAAPWATIGDNTKFEVAPKEINLSWQCQVLGGPIANRLGEIYVRNLYEKVFSVSEAYSNTSDKCYERDWHFCVDSAGGCMYDTFGIYDTYDDSGTSQRPYQNSRTVSDGKDEQDLAVHHMYYGYKEKVGS